MNKRLFGAAILGLGLVLGSAQMANATTWNLSAVTSTGNPLGNVKSFSSGGQVLDVTGWSSNAGGNFSKAAVNEYSGLGLGVCNGFEFPTCSSPNHAVDNSGSIDFILLMFDADMTIASFDVSSFGYDTDVTYYVGHSNAFTTGTWDISSLSPSTFGFTAYGSSGGSYDRTVNVNKIGNFILIAAATPNPDYNTDYFKLDSITATICNVVPEPATWSLMILSFAVMASRYRRRQSAKA